MLEGGDAHVDVACGHEVPRRGRARRSARPGGARADQRGSPSRGRDDPTRREAPLLRRPRLDLGAGCGVRSRRRAHVVRRARARRRAVDARCSTRAPASVGSPTISTAARSSARCCSPICTGITCRASRSSRPAIATTRTCACSCRIRPDADGRAREPADVLALAMSPPHFPIGPDGLRGDWTFESVKPGSHRIEGFDVVAFDVPHKGGRTFGYRISDGARRRSRTSPITARRPTRRPRSRASARASTCSCTTRSSSSTSGRSPTSTATRPSTTRSTSPSAAAPAAWRCSTTRRPGSDDEVDAIGTAAIETGAGRGVEVVVAREEDVIDLRRWPSAQRSNPRAVPPP